MDDCWLALSQRMPQAERRHRETMMTATGAPVPLLLNLHDHETAARALLPR